MKCELRCIRCSNLSEHEIPSTHVNIIRREMTVEFCPSCGKSTLHGLVSFEEEKRQEPELTEQQKDLIERCNK